MESATIDAPTEVLQIVDLPVEQCIIDPVNPRRHWKKPELDKMAHSLKTHGQINPVIGRPTGQMMLIGERTVSQIGILSGSKRFKGVEIAKLKTIKAIIRRDLSEEDAMILANLDNIGRSDVHPLDEALSYENILKKTKFDVGSLSNQLEVSETYVYQRLQLLKLGKESQDALWDELISFSHAVHISRIPAHRQAEALRYALTPSVYDGSTPTAAELWRWMDENIFLELAGAPWPLDDGQLVPSVGSCLACPKRTGYQPALFPDLTKGDICTDARCFASKKSAFLQRQENELRKQNGGGPVIKLVDVATKDLPDHTVNARDVVACDRTDRGATPVLVNIPNSPQFAQITYVKPIKADSARVDKMQADERAKQDEAVRCERIYRAELLSTTLGDMGPGLKREDLEDLAHFLVSSATPAHIRFLLQKVVARYWPTQDVMPDLSIDLRAEDWQKRIAGVITGCDGAELKRLIMGCVWAHTLAVAGADPEQGREELEAIAARVGVDLAYVRKRAKAAAKKEGA